MDDLWTICKGAIPEMRTIRIGKKQADGALQLAAAQPWRSAAAEDLVWLFCWREGELIDFSLQMRWNQETEYERVAGG